MDDLWTVVTALACRVDDSKERLAPSLHVFQPALGCIIADAVRRGQVAEVMKVLEGGPLASTRRVSVTAVSGEVAMSKRGEDGVRVIKRRSKPEHRDDVQIPSGAGITGSVRAMATTVEPAPRPRRMTKGVRILQPTIEIDGERVVKDGAIQVRV